MILGAVISQIFLFDEIPNTLGWIGMALVTISVSMPAVKNLWKMRQEGKNDMTDIVELK